METAVLLHYWKRLQVLRNRGARILVDCDYRTYGVDMFSAQHQWKSKFP